MKKIQLFTEFLYFILLALLIVIIFNKSLFYKGIPSIIVSLFIYGILSFAFYISYNSKNFTPKNAAIISLPKIDISEKLKNNYVNYSQLFIGLSKLIIAIIPTVIFVLNSVTALHGIGIVVLLIVLIVKFFLIFLLAIKYHLLSEGYTNLSFLNTIRHGLFYYNKDDKRAIVDKPIGAGVTVNFATKQGRMVFYVLISIPLTVILILSIVFLVTKNK